MTTQSPWASPSGETTPSGTPAEQTSAPPADGAAGAADPYPAAPRFGDYHTAPAGTQEPSAWQPDPTGPQGEQTGPAYQPFGAPAPGMPTGFMPAPKPGIIPLRPLNIGEIIGGAFESLRANPRAMFVPSVVVILVMSTIVTLITYLVTGRMDPYTLTVTTSSSEPAQEVLSASVLRLATYFGSLMLIGLATSVMSGLLIVTVSRSVLGRVATPGEVWERTRSRIVPLVGQALLISLITIVMYVVIGLAGAGIIVWFASSLAQSGGVPSAGTVIALVVGVIALVLSSLALGTFFAVRLALAPAALVLENVGVLEGIKRSWSLTRRSFWRILGILLLASIITGTISGSVSFAAGFAMAAGTYGLPQAQLIINTMGTVVISLLQALILPFTAAVTALTYIDLRMRKEGLDVELRQAATS